MTRVYLDEWAQPRQTLMQCVMGVILAEPHQVMTEARAVLARTEDGGRAPNIVDLVETILVYKLAPTISREEILKMLNVQDVDIKQSRFYQEVFAEGRQEGEATLILRQLQRRCGELTPAIREQVMRLSLPQVEALGEALLEFRDLADVEQWLATHGLHKAKSAE